MDYFYKKEIWRKRGTFEEERKCPLLILLETLVHKLLCAPLPGSKFKTFWQRLQCNLCCFYKINLIYHNVKFMILKTITLQHISVRVISDCINMRWHFMSFLSLVSLNNIVSVDWQPFVRIHHNTEEPRVGLKNQNENDIAQV